LNLPDRPRTGVRRPGHIPVARHLGAPGSSLALLVSKERVVTRLGAIID
jgi:hypothetical protein